MKIAITIFLAAGVFLATCKKVDVADGTPNCIKQEIRSFEKAASCSDPLVDEFEFQSETVYVFSPGSCGADMTSAVFDTKCEVIGHLGGITGNTKIEGQDFASAKFIRNIWKK